jgi:hypothetical protein
MDPIVWLLTAVDPVLIAPFRFFANPMAGWWVGIAALAFWSVLLGEVTMAGVFRVNRNPMVEHMNETAYYHEQSFKAKQAGNEKAYSGINRLASEAFGKFFFLMITIGMAALWPAFFAAAWLDMRFGDLVFSLPECLGALELNFLAPFILCYAALRLAYAGIKHLLIKREKMMLGGFLK